MSTEPAKESSAKKEYTLEKDCELRFEIDNKVQVTVEVRTSVGFSDDVNNLFVIIILSFNKLRKFE